MYVDTTLITTVKKILTIYRCVLKGVTFPDTGSTPPRERPMSEVTQRWVLVQHIGESVVVDGNEGFNGTTWSESV